MRKVGYDTRSSDHNKEVGDSRPSIDILLCSVCCQITQLWSLILLRTTLLALRQASALAFQPLLSGPRRDPIGRLRAQGQAQQGKALHIYRHSKIWNCLEVSLTHSLVKTRCRPIVTLKYERAAQGDLGDLLARGRQRHQYQFPGQRRRA